MRLTPEQYNVIRQYADEARVTAEQELAEFKRLIGSAVAANVAS